METIEPNGPALIVFACAWTMCCVGLFYLSGALPLRAAPEALRRHAGPALVIANVMLFVVLTIATVLYGLSELRVSSVIVVSGLIFLFAPLLVQELPKPLKDTQLGLMIMMVLGSGSVALMSAFGGLAAARQLIIG